MRYERSAGFVVCVESPGESGGVVRKYLLLDYGEYWDLPKGHVEPGESDLVAARRELAEETGIVEVQPVDRFARQIEYFFRRRGELTQKQVIFFLTIVDDETVAVSDEHVGYVWATIDLATEKLTYSAARELVRQADAHLIAMKTRQ